MRLEVDIVEDQVLGIFAALELSQTIRVEALEEFPHQFRVAVVVEHEQLHGILSDQRKYSSVFIVRVDLWLLHHWEISLYAYLLAVLFHDGFELLHGQVVRWKHHDLSLQVAEECIHHHFKLYIGDKEGFDLVRLE